MNAREWLATYENTPDQQVAVGQAVRLVQALVAEVELLREWVESEHSGGIDWDQILADAGIEKTL